jgi:hypothetical protein
MRLVRPYCFLKSERVQSCTKQTNKTLEAM